MNACTIGTSFRFRNEHGERVSVEGCNFVQLKPKRRFPKLFVRHVSVEGCKFVQLKLEIFHVSMWSLRFQLKDVSLYN